MKDKQLTALEKLVSLQEEANRKLGSIERLLEKQSKPTSSYGESLVSGEENSDEKRGTLMTKSGPLDFGNG